MNFKENGERHMEVLEGGDERKKSWAYNIISKNVYYNLHYKYYMVGNICFQTLKYIEYQIAVDSCHYQKEHNNKIRIQLNTRNPIINE